jgi:cytoskeletal protein CcmA (bactofilin family)
MLGGGSKNKRIEAADKLSKVDTIIGQGSSFEGNLISQGMVRIDGSLKGDIETQGDVYIGEKASVEGNIKARNLFVGGYIKGIVLVTDRLELNATAQLYGSITVGNLIIEEGAVFKGDCMTVLAKEATDKTSSKANNKTNNKAAQPVAANL